MTLKEVFQLAESKGYIPTDYTLNENGFHGYLSDDQYYLEMCFIQKWLRDSHKLFVEVVIMQPNKYAFTVYDTKTAEEVVGYTDYSNTPLEALSQGISKALQLF